MKPKDIANLSEEYLIETATSDQAIESRAIVSAILLLTKEVRTLREQLDELSLKKT